MNNISLIKETISLPPSFSVTADAEEYRNQLALKARDITAIASPVANAEAADVCRDIRKHLKEVEKMRVDVTAPFLTAQRTLKALADDHVAPLKAELDRVEALGTAWVLAERRRVEQEEAARQAEIARLAKEKAEAEAKAAAMALPVAVGVPDDEDQWHREQAAKAAADAAEAKLRTAIVAPAPEVQKAKGQQVRQVLRWECVDVRALYAARPELCLLTPKPAAIQATCHPDMPVPGLKLWFEEVATFTSR